jgi:Cd2+/Zn2+-exporting ATPase
MSCPCALVLSVPLAFFSGIGAGSKRGILFKGGATLEHLSKVRAVVMDKTGTVTKGNFEVQKCVSSGQYSEDELLKMAAECELQSTHPIAHSIVKEARRRGFELEQPESIEEIAGKGIHVSKDNAEILCGNRELLEMYQIEVSGQENTPYGTEVFVACDGKFAGYILISDTLKEESVVAIADLKNKRIKTVMLTGDATESAEAIAKETGIEEVYAKLLPEEKLERLQQVREQYGSVMFVGDGINDAPVLAGADVGAAMGSGADAAIEAADVVFMTSSMQAIPEALKIAKITNRIAIQNIVFALAVKGFVMVMGLFGLANMWMAVFADTGVAMLCVLNSIRILRRK